MEETPSETDTAVVETALPEIDTAKLRRIMRERHQAFERARALSDRFMEIRSDIARFESTIEAPGRNVDKQQRGRELAELASMKEERAQIQADREAASAAAKDYGFFENLIRYASRLGFVVDESRGTVRRRREGEPMRIRT